MKSLYENYVASFFRWDFFDVIKSKNFFLLLIWWAWDDFWKLKNWNFSSENDLIVYQSKNLKS